MKGVSGNPETPFLQETSYVIIMLNVLFSWVFKGIISIFIYYRYQGNSTLNNCKTGKKVYHG